MALAAGRAGCDTDPADADGDGDGERWLAAARLLPLSRSEGEGQAGGEGVRPLAAAASAACRAASTSASTSSTVGADMGPPSSCSPSMPGSPSPRSVATGGSSAALASWEMVACTGMGVGELEGEVLGGKKEREGENSLLSCSCDLPTRSTPQPHPALAMTMRSLSDKLIDRMCLYTLRSRAARRLSPSPADVWEPLDREKAKPPWGRAREGMAAAANMNTAGLGACKHEGNLWCAVAPLRC